MNLLPQTSGVYSTSVSPNFFRKLSDRIESGLWPQASAHRNAYQVVSRSDSHLRFRSTNLLTSISVGLNDVTVSLDRKAKNLRFKVAYWAWANYAIVLSGMLGAALALCLTVGRLFLPPAWFVEYDQSPIFAWTMILFWGLIWPWILIGMHKSNVRRCLTNLLDELNQKPIDIT